MKIQLDKQKEKTAITADSNANDDSLLLRTLSIHIQVYVAVCEVIATTLTRCILTKMNHKHKVLLRPFANRSKLPFSFSSAFSLTLEMPSDDVSYEYQVSSKPQPTASLLTPVTSAQNLPPPPPQVLCF